MQFKFVPPRLQYLLPTSVFFNLGSAEPRGSLHSSLSSARLLKLTLFWVSRFRQTFSNVSKVPQLEKGWKTLTYTILYSMEMVVGYLHMHRGRDNSNCMEGSNKLTKNNIKCVIIVINIISSVVRVGQSGRSPRVFQDFLKFCDSNLKMNKD